MAKLKLQLDDLTIDSFTTTTVKRENGTVYGEQYTEPGNVTCYNTCALSCYGTCEAVETCDYTCRGFATYGVQAECILCG